MKLLPDTHLLLWAAGKTERLSEKARALLEDVEAEVWFSVASIWEIAIKHALGRADFEAEPRRLRALLLENGWNELAVRSEHAFATMALPAIHKDPFDRILIAQAETEELVLMTVDDRVAQYSADIVLV